MISEVLRKKDLSQNFTSDWQQMTMQNIDKISLHQDASTINISWNDVRFVTLSPPELIIECSDDGIHPVVIKKMVLDSTSNHNDITAFVITQIFNFIRFKIQSNSCDRGDISIFINYR